MENRIEHAFRTTHATEGSRKTTFSVSKRPNGLRGLSGAPWEASWSFSGTLLAANLTPLARPWALLGSFGAALGRSWLALGDASSRKFSKLRLPDPIFFDLCSVWAQKPPKLSKNRAKSLRKLETSAANSTSDSNEGAAVARSELNNKIGI